MVESGGCGVEAKAAEWFFAEGEEGSGEADGGPEEAVEGGVEEFGVETVVELVNDGEREGAGDEDADAEVKNEGEGSAAFEVGEVFGGIGALGSEGGPEERAGKDGGEPGGGAEIAPV